MKITTTVTKSLHDKSISHSTSIEIDVKDFMYPTTEKHIKRLITLSFEQILPEYYLKSMLKE